MDSIDLKNVSSNGIPVGHRSTFSDIVNKYKSSSLMAQWAYRSILKKRISDLIDSEDFEDIDSFIKTMREL